MTAHPRAPPQSSPSTAAVFAVHYFLGSPLFIIVVSNPGERETTERARGRRRGQVDDPEVSEVGEKVWIREAVDPHVEASVESILFAFSTPNRV